MVLKARHRLHVLYKVGRTVSIYWDQHFPNRRHLEFPGDYSEVDQCEELPGLERHVITCLKHLQHIVHNY